MIRHSTASVFVIASVEGEWRLGLVMHPRFQRWMLPGGHVEESESPAQTAIREVREETGLDVELLNTPGLGLPQAATSSVVPRALWIVEQDVPAESRLAQPHVHVDHLYVAVANEPAASAVAELPFRWYGPDELAGLEMFDDSRRYASAVLASVDVLLARHAAV